MKHLFFTFFLIVNGLMFSQSDYKKSVDSLYVLVNKTTNTQTKIDYYQNICKIYFENDLVAFEKCNKELLLLSNSIKSNKGYGFYYCNKAKISSYSNRKEAITYSKKASQLFYRIKDWDNYIHASTILANNLLYDDKDKQAIELLNQLLAIGLEKNSKHLSSIYLEFSNIYCGRGDFPNALLYAEKALKCKVINDNYLIYNTISNIYRRMTHYNKAIEYNDKALSMSKSLHSIYNTKFNKVNILCDMGRSKEALPLAFTCLKYYEKQGFLLKVDYLQFMISYAYFNLGNYKRANYYVDVVLKNPPARSEYQVDKYSHKADISLALNDLKTSNFFTDKALKLLDSSVSYNMKAYVYDIKVNLEEKLGNYQEALAYHKKILDVENEKYYENRKHNIQQIEVELDLAEKNNRIKNLQIADLKRQAVINTKSNYISYISIAFFIAILSVLFYINNYRTIRNKNAIIEKEKLLTQKSLSEKETLLKEIHHRVKNNLQLVMSLLYLQSKQKDISMKEFVATSQSRILSMALVHENLYGKNDLSKVDFKEYLYNLEKNITESHNNSNKDIQLKIVSENIFLDIQTATPLGLIINELVSNAYKHAFKNRNKGSITVTLNQKEKEYILKIDDDGNGISDNSKTTTTLGVELVKQSVKQIQGSMSVENNNGTHYSITFN